MFYDPFLSLNFYNVPRQVTRQESHNVAQSNFLCPLPQLTIPSLDDDCDDQMK